MDDSFIVRKLVLPKFRHSVKNYFALYRSGHVKKTKETNWEGHNIRIRQRQKSKSPSGMAVGLGIISRYEKDMDQVSEHGQDPCSRQCRTLNKYNNSRYGHSNAWLLWQDTCIVFGLKIRTNFPKNYCWQLKKLSGSLIKSLCRHSLPCFSHHGTVKTKALVTHTTLSSSSWNQRTWWTVPCKVKEVQVGWYEHRYSNAMWRADWHMIRDSHPKRLNRIVFLDDAFQVLQRLKCSRMQHMRTPHDVTSGHILVHHTPVQMLW